MLKQLFEIKYFSAACKTKCTKKEKCEVICPALSLRLICLMIGDVFCKGKFKVGPLKCNQNVIRMPYCLRYAYALGGMLLKKYPVFG